MPIWRQWWKKEWNKVSDPQIYHRQGLPKVVRQIDILKALVSSSKESITSSTTARCPHWLESWATTGPLVHDRSGISKLLSRPKGTKAHPRLNQRLSKFSWHKMKEVPNRCLRNAKITLQREFSRGKAMTFCKSSEITQLLDRQIGTKLKHNLYQYPVSEILAPFLH